MAITKVWPAAMAWALRVAFDFRSASFPSTRVKHAPEASLNAMPNFICGTVLTMASYRSSTVLMKWLWPTMMFPFSGISNRTDFSSIEPTMILAPTTTKIRADPRPPERASRWLRLRDSGRATGRRQGRHLHLERRGSARDARRSRRGAHQADRGGWARTRRNRGRAAPRASDHRGRVSHQT